MIRLRATLMGAKCRFGSNASPRRDAISARPVALVRTAPRRKSRRLMCNVVIFCCMTSFPKWLVPMAATLTQERFTGPEWIFERKFDGIRLLAFKQGQDVGLFSRNRLPQNIPGVAQAIRNLPVDDLILDGEMTWGGKVSYHVFDIMWLDGRDLTSLPLEERRELLSQLPLREPLLPVEALSTDYADYTDNEEEQPREISLTEKAPIGSVDGLLPWERARTLGWEGVIAKRRGSLYEQRRSPHWL